MKSIAILVILVLLLLSCDLDPGRMVRFYASSTSGLVFGSYMTSVDYINNWLYDEPSPWSVDVAAEKGDYVLLTVTNSLSTGTVVGRIYVDGVLFGEKSGTDSAIIQVGGYID